MGASGRAGLAAEAGELGLVDEGEGGVGRGYTSDEQESVFEHDRSKTRTNIRTFEAQTRNQSSIH